MAAFAITNGYVMVNSVVLSDHVKSFELNIDSNSVDTTAMGDTYATEIGGVKSAGLNIEFYNDHAAAQTDVTLFPLLGTVTTFEVRSDGGAVSATNPKYSGSVHVNGHSMGGSHGDAAMISVSYPTSGTVTRATS